MNIAHIFIVILVLVHLIRYNINLDFLILFKDMNFEYYQLLSSSFLHWNFEHLLFNSIALLQVSYFNQEESEWSFIFKWIIFAMWASIASYYIEINPVLWASWVIMWMLSYYYMKYRKRYDVSWLLVLIVINILIWILPWISFWGHFGWALMWFLYYFIENKGRI